MFPLPSPLPCSDSSDSSDWSLREAAKEDAEPDAAQAVRGRFKGFAFDLDQLLKES